MKVFISYKTKGEAWGGGNQFLKNLKDKFLKMQQICDDPKDADIILFNSHHNLIETLQKSGVERWTVIQHCLSIMMIFAIIMAINSNSWYSVDTELFGGESWHSDVTWMKPTGYVSILHAIDLPDVGGDTAFSSTISAFGSADKACGGT